MSGGRGAERPRSGMEVAALEAALGHRFADAGLLTLALTHRSRSGSRNNERLEFLGDAFLGFVVAEALFRRHEQAAESELTLLRASLVRKRTLAEIGRRLALGDHLLLGPGELKSGGFRRDSILADAVEAIIGAVLLDGGEAAARTVVLRLLGERLEHARPETAAKDPKTRLQEALQARALALPVYQVIGVGGSDHAREFVVACELGERGVRTEGRGRSRRAAEQAAADAALAVFEERER